MSRSKKTWDHLVDGTGNFGIKVRPDGQVEGNFIGSGGDKGDKGQQGASGIDGEKGDTGSIGQQGVKGEEGLVGAKGEIGDKGEGFAFNDLSDAQKLQITGADGDKGDKGADGVNGTPGTDGTDGDSAYELAVAAGFVGTEAEWLANLNGLDGDKGQKGEEGLKGLPGADATSFLRFKGELATAAELAGVTNLEFGDVYYITDEQTFYGYNAEGNWVAIGTGDRIKGERGEKGDDGRSAYEVAIDNGFTGSEATWLKGLKGADGVNGDKGDEGKSAYQSYVDTTADNPALTEFAWQLSLKGENGVKGDKLTFQDLTDVEKESLKGATGQKGDDGQKGEEGDEGIKGEKGVDGTIGADGDSAYDIYVNTTADNPVLGDTAWLESLKGDKGEFTPVDEFYTKGQSDGRYVKKAGDTMTGALKIQKTGFAGLDLIGERDDASSASARILFKNSNTDGFDSGLLAYYDGAGETPRFSFNQRVEFKEGLETVNNSRVLSLHLDSGQDSDLQIYRDSERRILVGTDEVVLDKIAKYNTDVSVVDDKHLTSKKYVDEKVLDAANLSIQVTNNPSEATTNIFYNPDTKMLVMKVN